MNSLKTFVVLAVLGAVGYGVYVSLHKKSADAPPGNSAFAPPKTEIPAFTQPGNLLSRQSPANDAKDRFSAPATRLVAESGTKPPDANNPFGSAGATTNNQTNPATTAPTPAPGWNDKATDANNNSAIRTVAIPPRDTAPSQSNRNIALASNNPELPRGTNGSPASTFSTVWKAAQEQLKQGRFAEAHLALSMIYDEPLLSDTESRQLRDMLDQLAGTVVYSTQHHLEPAYIVQPGDRLQSIADKYQVPKELLAKINGIDNPDALQPGEQLKVVRGPFNAKIYLERRELTLFLGSRYAGRFAIGIGRDLPLVEPTYVVRDKVVNPKYFGANGQQIEPGDPANPLGSRWIGLGPSAGIHGTNNPRSIGRDDLSGCISLSAKDIVDLYDILSPGSQVSVRK